MQEEQEKKGQPIGRRIFKLIDGSLVFGECETVTTKNGQTEILIKTRIIFIKLIILTLKI